MYVMDAKIREEIEKKAGQYEATKNKIKERIEENVRIAIEKLMDAEKELLVEMEAELGENPFAEFLGDESHTEDDAKEIMKKKIPHDFGPDEGSFKSIYKEIYSLKEWRKKPKPEQLIPKKVAVKEARLDSISISWNAVEGAKNYLVEVDGGDEIFWKPETSNTLTKVGLLPDTEHTFRVRTIHERVMGEWSDAVRGRTKKLPAPSNVKAKSESWDSITLTWDVVEGASSYQIEVDGSRSLERVTSSAFTKKGLLPETEHSFRFRALRGNSVGEWSNVVRGRTKKLLVPSNIKTSITEQDSITLTWDAVEGASSYQVEVDGSRSLERVTSSTFTKRGLLPDTEHSFRVRAVRGNSVSEWSGVVKGRTQRKSFETSAWKECPDNVDKDRKYSVDEKNPRIAKKIGNDWNFLFGDGNLCTIIGNTPLPLNKVTSWNIKILKSKENNGGNIFIGVAPFDIDQKEGDNYNKCGWYFYCYESALNSGPPHKYRGNECGPRKGNGEYVRNGDSVGVVMDTAKGELSFVLNGVNLGVAYEGIPLDKPLVPCVILGKQGDSVELVI